MPKPSIDTGMGLGTDHRGHPGSLQQFSDRSVSGHYPGPSKIFPVSRWDKTRNTDVCHQGHLPITAGPWPFYWPMGPCLPTKDGAMWSVGYCGGRPVSARSWVLINPFCSASDAGRGRDDVRSVSGSQGTYRLYLPGHSKRKKNVFWKPWTWAEAP